MKNNQSSTASLWFVLSLSVFTISTFDAHANADQLVNDRISLASDDASNLDNATMEGHRGSGGISTEVSVSSDQNLSASSTGNSVNVRGNMTNGSITTGSNFGGSGFGSYVMNTGNNATINSGVSLSVLMMPSTPQTP